jgi:hypothetical protein
MRKYVKLAGGRRASRTGILDQYYKPLRHVGRRNVRQAFKRAFVAQLRGFNAASAG